MTDLPDPLTPPDCDLSGYEWMPLLGHRLFSSAWYRYARKDPRGGIAALKLWWVAMLQRPAGSLPNDEDDLCMLADFGEDMKAWNKHRQVAMHGFILCSDNRWYHPVCSDQAVKAYELRIKADETRKAGAERLKRWRAKQNGTHPPEGGPSGGNAPETPTETCLETVSETADVTRYGRSPDTRSETDRETAMKHNDKTRPYKTRQDKEEKGERLSPKPPLARACREDPTFAAFYAAYPLHEAPDEALKAWRQVLAAGAIPPEIMAGLARYSFRPDPKFIKHPASWLRAGCWKSEPGLGFDPVLRAAGLGPEDFDDAPLPRLLQ